MSQAKSTLRPFAKSRNGQKASPPDGVGGGAHASEYAQKTSGRVAAGNGHADGLQAAALPSLITAIVAAEGFPRFIAEADGRRHEALLAPSCLMIPEKGDSVLLVRLPGEQNSFQFSAIAVLARADPARPCRLRLPDESRLETGGNLELASSGRLDLRGGQAVNLESEEINLTASMGRACFSGLEAVVGNASAWFKSLHTMGEQAMAVFGAMTQCLKKSRRMVEEDDQTRAGSSTLMVAETAVIQSRNAIIAAEEVARVDAGQIQLG